MLIEFTVRNYRAIKDEQTFSLLSSEINKDDNRIHNPHNKEKFNYLKSSSIYGANGSGKSTWFYALFTFWEMIIYSNKLRIETPISSYSPFLFDIDCQAAPTLFEIEFLSNESIRYKYRVEFDSSHIISESLYYFPNKRQVLLFERNSNCEVKLGNSLKLKSEYNHENGTLLKNNLFLSVSVNTNIEELRAVYYFIKYRFIFYGIDKRSIAANFTTLYLNNLENVQFKNILMDFLKAADSGIVDIEIRKRKHPDSEVLVKTTESKLHKWESLQPVTFHKVFKNGIEHSLQEISMEDESIGTQKMYNLGGLIIYVLQHGISLIVDELDTSFHPLMSEYILSLFSNNHTNPKSAQLIFTTQETSLLNEDNFRQDQIWFAEKDDKGATQLYSLYEFNNLELKHGKLASWYLSGRFGALPCIDKKLVNLDDSLKDFAQVEDFYRLD